jgi:DTW domain-containing protein YfiP
MSEFACFCHLRNSGSSSVEFILLFHRDEIHKPTNSGRLIADLFPDDTKAYLWSRTNPPKDLIEYIESKPESCTVLFPNTETAKAQNRMMRATPPNTHKQSSKHTFIILDGTWKQASKMFHQSEWLKPIPHFEINSDAQRSFLVRHSSHQMQFATAEVSAMLLDVLGHTEQSQQLLRYYQIFNKQCLVSRKRGADIIL